MKFNWMSLYHSNLKSAVKTRVEMHVDTINCSVTLIYNVIRSRCSIETMGTQKHDSIEQVLVVFFN